MRSPTGGDSHPPGQTTQLASAGVTPGLTQQARDRFTDDQVVMDELGGEVLGVQQYVHALVPGLLHSAESTADRRPELGLAAIGQPFGMHRLGGLQRLAMLAEPEGQRGAVEADAGRPEPQVGPGADLGVHPGRQRRSLIVGGRGVVVTACPGRRRRHEVQHSARLHRVAGAQLARQCLRRSHRAAVLPGPIELTRGGTPHEGGTSQPRWVLQRLGALLHSVGGQPGQPTTTKIKPSQSITC